MAELEATNDQAETPETADVPTESTTQDEEELTQEDIDRRDAILSQRTKKRIYIGMHKKDIFKYKPTAISEKDGLYAMSEYIKELITHDYTNVEKIIDIPRDFSASNGRLQFQVETMKNFLIEVGLFVVYLSNECNNTNCNKMQATSKFRYRCSAHRKPKDCNAIQYCVHTLDLFTEKMNNKEYNVCSNNYNKIPEKKAKKDIGDLCRRVYRIFAHAFYHHQTLFDHYESKHLLCTRFIMFFRKYQLVPNALFKREIQIPTASLYFSRQARKERLRQYFIKRKKIEEQQKNELEAAKKHVSSVSSIDEFMKNSAVAELESDEIY
eukprot:61315_1